MLIPGRGWRPREDPDSGWWTLCSTWTGCERITRLPSTIQTNMRNALSNTGGGKLRHGLIARGRLEALREANKSALWKESR